MTHLAAPTAGHLVAPDGSLLERPTTILDADSALIIRNYFYWMLRQQLEPELFCHACFDHSRESKATYQIDESQIVIVCLCSMRFFQGPWTKPAVWMTPAVTLPSDDGGVAKAILSEDSARLLRLYKKVLIATGLQEALRCNACYDLGLPDGCEAQVLDSKIVIRCRCTRRTFVGSAL